MNDLLDVKLTNFEGPLDLLIHLIYRNEMNIYDISISLITDQFISAINEMEKMDIEVASEFIQMASYLVYLKSKMLLPKSSILGEELDPEEEKFIFTQRLIEYSFYKDISEILSEKEKESSIFLKRQETFYLPKTDNQVEDYHQLSSLFFELITKDKTENMVLEKNTLDLNIVTERIKNTVSVNNEVFWSEIIKYCKNKREIAVSMVAILELIKLKVIMAFQDGNFTDFLVKKYGT
jgi:segregation and condensation protein A